ncbi:TIGR01459 family HAD-type hydrolase [Enterobacter ludwigii]|uniref:TIGR01459 family HAD-type hydrolase n=1 Tax=Enterobacter ludwigii TaxID=299767 RepID=UPI003F6F403B
MMKRNIKCLACVDEVPAFEGYLVDVWGVLYDGQSKTHIADDLLRKMKMHGRIALVSNTSRTSEELAVLLNGKGISETFIDGIFTSGSLCKERITRHFAANPQHTFFLMGTAGECHWLTAMLDRQVSSIETCDFVIAANIIYENDEEIERSVRKITERGLVVYSTNPDKLVNIGGRIHKAAGYFCQKVREAGGTVYEYGKPGEDIFNIALAGIGVEKENACMVGDSMKTDISGGNSASLKTILVAGCGGLQYSEDELNEGLHDYILNLQG